jgi:hypothetical protein
MWMDVSSIPPIRCSIRLLTLRQGHKPPALDDLCDHASLKGRGTQYGLISAANFLPDCFSWLLQDPYQATTLSAAPALYLVTQS